MKEPTSKRVDPYQSEAMQELRDLTLHSGQGYDDDDDIKKNLGDEENEETLAKSITKVVKNIPHSEYIKTFEKYKERLELCIIAEGDYFEHFMK